MPALPPTSDERGEFQPLAAQFQLAHLGQPGGLRPDPQQRDHDHRGGRRVDRGLHPHHLEGHENAHGGECEKHGPRHGHGPNPDLRFVLFTLRVKSRRPLQRDTPAHRRRPSQPHAEREEYGSSNNPGVSSANKTSLGLNPKTSTPQPITAPTRQRSEVGNQRSDFQPLASGLCWHAGCRQRCLAGFSG